MEAIALAHARGCNPGGEVAGATISDAIEQRIPTSYRNRLLSRDEAEGFDALVARP
jgi:hypothetical protein